MSQPRLHHLLAQLYEHKDSLLLNECLNHSDYDAFKIQHGLEISSSDLQLVFTHTSFSHEFNVPHQEQLEFLGDAVLQLLLTEEIFARYSSHKEGQLSKLRSALVNEKTLATIASHLKLGELLLVGKGEFKKKLFEQESVLADTLEALLAAIYRQHGFSFTKKLFLEWLNNSFTNALSWDFIEEFDAKSKLQELSLAKYKKLPRYSSENHAEKFLVQLWINDQMLASGIFPSKKMGEKELASEIIKKGLI
jgi:ribonuclease-3